MQTTGLKNRRITRIAGWLGLTALVGLLVAGCTGAKKTPTVVPGATEAPTVEARTGVTPSPAPRVGNSPTPVVDTTPTPRPGVQVPGFRLTLSGTVLSDEGAPLDAVQVTGWPSSSWVGASPSSASRWPTSTYLPPARAASVSS